MTIEELIAQIRAGMQTQLVTRATHTTTIQTVRGACAPDGRNPTDAEAEQVRAAQAAIEAIDTEVTAAQARIDQLEAERQSNERAAELARSLSAAGAPAGAGGGQERRVGGAQVTAEDRTYTGRKDQRGEASFFADSYRAQVMGDGGAQQRLQRHAVEVEREGEMNRYERATSTSSFSTLVVPQYLVDQAALVLRFGRPLANMCQHLPLPAQGMSLNIPRATTGMAVSSQATENTALQNTDEVWANLQPPVVTIGGQQDVSRQSLERGEPGIDQLIFMDGVGAYHSELDRQVANGSGASNQMLGIFQTSGINAATAYGAAPTIGLFNSKVAGQIAAIAGVGSAVIPRFTVMHPRRWGWLTSLVDSQGRPLLPAQSGGPMNAMGVNVDPGTYGGDGQPDNRDVFATQGVFAGLPVVTDANVPTNVGTNSEDLSLVLDPSKAYLWEDGDGQPRQLRFDQTLSGQLTVKLVIYGYAAFTAGRYPVAFGKTGGLDVTGGQGQVAPTF